MSVLADPTAKTSIGVGVVGGSGYTGAELLRLLVDHPSINLLAVTSRGQAGERIDVAYPSLRGKTNAVFVEPSTAALADCELIFFATPNGTALQQAPELLARGIKVIDLAADFRIKDVAVWEQFYGMQHTCPEWVARAVYGLPELNRAAIRDAQLIANPGCYPTSVSLGFMPLLTANAVYPTGLIADAKSGVSGAGRQAKVEALYGEVDGSFKAYAVHSHRHWPEIRQTLGDFMVDKTAPELVFVPHLVPMMRGIHATLYARLRDPKLDVQALFEAHYANEPFVDVMPAGSHPTTGSVRGANHCRIAVHRPQGGDIVVVLSVIDNLVKGAAGQAIQNMNLMFGRPENEGLTAAPLWP
ncbi:MAG: N-acetyl-gamma-glutamyl-phosphate reductase [Gammaproteobacteria bacterium]|nr:N-acetyl-gamma-glutamyl-phosphate reductase [Gammaproteobacteria bacterium]